MAREKRQFVRDNPPALEEVEAYCLDRNSDVDPIYFYEKMTAIGWVYGSGIPLVDWKAAIRTWERVRQSKRPEARSNRGLVM